MRSNRPPYSKSVRISDEYSVDDIPDSVVKAALRRVQVWKCDNNHTNFTVFREGRNQSVSCSECSERYRI